LKKSWHRRLACIFNEKSKQASRLLYIFEQAVNRERNATGKK
jgi:hypothetical protein